MRTNHVGTGRSHEQWELEEAEAHDDKDELDVVRQVGDGVKVVEREMTSMPSFLLYRETACANAPVFLSTHSQDLFCKRRKGGEVGKPKHSTCRTAPDNQLRFKQGSIAAPVAGKPYLFGRGGVLICT